MWLILRLLILTSSTKSGLSKPVFSGMLNAVVSRYAAAFAAMKPVNAASISSAVAVKQKHSFQKQTVSVLLYSTTLRMEFVMD